MDKRHVKIAGAGIAGLTAAINLAKAGYQVIVYEANRDCGLRHNGDWQGIENWTTPKDALDDLKAMNIETSLPFIPIHNIVWFDAYGNRYESNIQAPIVYLLKRGTGINSLDQALKNQAISSGVQIEFTKSIPLKEADLVAIGPAGGKPYGMAYGMNFQTDVEDKVWSIFDDKIAPKGYAYFFVIKGEATLTTTILDDFKSGPRLLEETYKRFQEIQSFSAHHINKFVGIGGIKLHLTNKAIGEAAGIQDYLMGFGMRMAMRCGFLGAKSVIEGIDLKKLLIKNVLPLVKNSILNRKVFERIGNRGRSLLVRKLAESQNYRTALYKLYTHDFVEKPTFSWILKKMTDLGISI